MKNELFQPDFFDEKTNENLLTKDKHTNEGIGKPRLLQVNRSQIEFRIQSLDQLIPKNHKARLVWKFVDNLDLSHYLKNIKSVEGCPGRSAINPQILVSLWLYATIEGIASAHQLGRYCREHSAFAWICGDVKVGRKTLSNFRAEQGELLNELLAQSVAIMLDKELISLEEIGQDGMRVRASAGSSSFRTLKTLKERYKAAKKYITELQKEMADNSGKAVARREQIKLEKAKQQKEKIQSAIEEMKVFEKELNEGRKNHRKKTLNKEEKQKLRTSITDPKARKMKMGDGGFRPAYNVQFATTVKGQAIVSVGITHKGSDYNQLESMFMKLKKCYNVIPKSWLADNGFNNHDEIETLESEGCETYIPLKKAKNIDPHKPRKGESEALAKRRLRMGTDDAKEKYKLRAQTSEFPNAEARNRGMQRFLVNGIQKSLNVSLIFALTHNLLRMSSLSGLI
ncbi:MAG: transposase [Candidatus Nitrosomaritimum yanchengensis]